MREIRSAPQLFPGAPFGPVLPHPRGQHPPADVLGDRVSLISPNHGSSPRAFPRMLATGTGTAPSGPALWSPFVRNPAAATVVMLYVTGRWTTMRDRSEEHTSEL